MLSWHLEGKPGHQPLSPAAVTRGKGTLLNLITNITIEFQKRIYRKVEPMQPLKLRGNWLQLQSVSLANTPAGKLSTRPKSRSKKKRFSIVTLNMDKYDEKAQLWDGCIKR